MAGVVYIDPDSPVFDDVVDNDTRAEREPIGNHVMLAGAIATFHVEGSLPMDRGGASVVLAVLSQMVMISANEIADDYAGAEEDFQENGFVYCRMNNANTGSGEEANYRLDPLIYPISRLAQVTGYEQSPENSAAFVDYLCEVRRMDTHPERYMLFWFEFNYLGRACITRPALVDLDEAAVMCDKLTRSTWFAHSLSVFVRIQDVANEIAAVCASKAKSQTKSTRAPPPKPPPPLPPTPMPPKHNCALPICRADCSGDRTLCLGCNDVVYCCKSHRRAHERVHRPYCNGSEGKKKKGAARKNDKKKTNHV